MSEIYTSHEQEELFGGYTPEEIRASGEAMLADTKRYGALLLSWVSHAIDALDLAEGKRTLEIKD